MARIRPDVDPNTPIPNDPFSSPDTTYFRGPYYPAIVDSTSNITVSPDGVINVTGGGGGAVSGIFAGAGISVSGNTGAVTITNDGVQDLTAGSGISLDASTGSITVTNNGVLTLTAGSGISLNASTGNVTVSTTGGGGSVTTVLTGTGLTGGPITTSGTVALANTAVTPGPYTLANITVDAQGRLTSASNGSAVTSITAGTGLTGGTITGTGTIALNNTGVTAGPYSYPTLTIDAQGRITAAADGTAPVTSVATTAPAINLGNAVAPIISVQTATTGQLGAVQVGANINVAAGVISVDTSSTTQSGIVQLNNTLTSPSTTEALTAAQGKILQDQIAGLSSAANITLAGTFDASTSQLVSVTAAGTAAGFSVGSDLPFPAAGNTDYFVIVTTGGSYPPPGGGGPYTTAQGDWLLSNGTTWQFLNVGTDLPIASTGTAGIVELADTAETQAGTDATLAVTPAGAAATYVPISDFGAKGDLLSATAANTQVALPVGLDGEVLTACAAAPTGLCWATASTPAIPCACITGRGALVTGTAANAPVALTVGADGEVLTACSTSPSGLCWASAAIPCACLTAKGDIITTSTPNTPVALSVGLDNQVLFACSTAAAGLCWGNLPSATPTVQGIVYGCTESFLGGDGHTALGRCALSSVTPGSAYSNVAIGHNAACSLTVGFQNIVIGESAFCFVTGAEKTVAIGDGAGNRSSGCCNTIVGHFAGHCITGCSNVILGAGASNDATFSGCCNVIIGPNLNPPSWTASRQLAIGPAVNNFWLTGDSSLNIKPGAGIIDCTGSTGSAGEVLSSTGTALEWVAGGGGSPATPTTLGTLLGCTGSLGSTALGFCALSAWTSANSVAIGAYAMRTSTGPNNVVVGFQAMMSGNGASNVAVGCGTLRDNTTGICNTFLGTIAGKGVTTGCDNVGIGYGAQGGAAASTGSGNVSIGNRAAVALTSGDNNVVIGNCAGCCINTGNNNTIVGSRAGQDQTTGSGLTAIGFNSSQPAANVTNAAYVMHPNRVAYFTTGSWAFLSDRRAKDDIIALPVEGETFVNSLRPVQYTPLNEETKEPVNGGETHVGFIAQEVDDALKEAGMAYVNNLVSRPNDPATQHYALSTEVLVPFLVKAVQELSAKVAALEAKD